MASQRRDSKSLEEMSQFKIKLTDKTNIYFFENFTCGWVAYRLRTTPVSFILAVARANRNRRRREKRTLHHNVISL
jgi:glucose-6-phosphate dehydrogenase assembly protein OpcA